MSAKLKFNVIIPTRERKSTLIHCLRTVVAQDYENLNIIVSDNFSDDGTEEVVRSFNDPRVQYINTGRRISMSHNWEFALDHVTEGWVMFIGDDDGLYPGAIGTLNELVQRHKVEAVSSDHGAFIWPGHFLECEDGVLAVPLTHSAVVKNSILEARKVFAGKMPYQKLPWLYHGGAASLDLINRLRDGKGRFFCSQIPDLYSAVALSLGTKEFLSVGIPLVIAGSSKHSTGASQLGNKAVGGDNPSAQFNAEGNIPFHESLILGLSLQVVLYETYLQSTHLHDDALRISLEGQLHAAMTAAPRRFREEINKECQLIARKNGFEFVAKENAIARLLLALVRIPEFLRTSFLRLEVTPRELGLANISDAAAASSALYSFVRGRPAVLLSLGVGNLAGRVLSRARQFTKRM